MKHPGDGKTVRKKPHRWQSRRFCAEILLSRRLARRSHTYPPSLAVTVFGLGGAVNMNSRSAESGVEPDLFNHWMSYAVEDAGTIDNRLRSDVARCIEARDANRLELIAIEEAPALASPCGDSGNVIPLIRAAARRIRRGRKMPVLVS
jgi:hypothetical protein